MPFFNKIKFILFSISFLSWAFAFGGITQGQVEILFNKTEIGAAPKKGFHLNAQAPASAVFDGIQTKIQPKLKTEQKFLFELPGDAKKAQLKFFVCDDAKTVCEQHMHDIDVTAKRKYLEKKVTAEDLERRKYITVTSTTSQSLTTEDSKKYLSDEGLPTASAAAPASAKQGSLPLVPGKTTLVVFSAPWCPACIRLKSETLNQAAVKTQLKKVNAVHLNIDLVENEELSKKYNVKAIPTMILIGKNGKEINRWLDFQLADSFAKDLDSALTISEDLEQTRKMAEAGDQKSIRRLADNSFSQLDWAEASKWYGLSQNPADVQRKLFAEINKAKEDKDADKNKTTDHLKILLKNTELSQSKLDSLLWTIDYFEAKNEDKSFNSDEKEKIAATIRELNVFVDDPKLLTEELKKSMMTGLYGFEPLEVLDVIARGYDLLNDEGYKKHTQGRMYRMAASKKVNLDESGAVIHIIYYLTQAGKLSEAEALTKQLIEKYPDTYVYYSRYANLLLKNKRYDEALAQIDSALKYKEGNEPQLNLVKTKILVGLKKNTEALSLVDETIKLIEPYPEKYKRTKASLVSIKADLTK